MKTKIAICGSLCALALLFVPAQGLAGDAKPPQPPAPPPQAAPKPCGPLTARKVACPAACNAGEAPDKTTKCALYDPKLYKETGNGCAKYETVCWCAVPCPTLPDNFKL